MKICCFGLVLLLLLVLSAVLPADAQNDTPYQRFKNNHVYGSMTKDQCTSVIKKRKITQGKNECKDVNSFILANDKEINAVCTGAGAPQGGDLYMSDKLFPVIDCKLKSGARYPKCEYGEKGVESSRSSNQSKK
ncbi:ribonuclease-like 3 [Trichomycterus rosablanca]|uniref:ribonuclease-like 3 n=1 Tax=Trichomycterus rosablanca TaxID=2290929 RepID=UPI002F35A208